MSIVFENRSDPAAPISTNVNYGALLFGDPRFVGGWSAFHDTVRQQVGGVSSLASVKTNGVPAVQTDTTRRPSSYFDTDLQRTVLLFDNTVGKVLTATGLTWRPDLGYTIIAILNPTLGLNVGDLHMAVGDASLPDVVGLGTLNDRAQFQGFSGRLASAAAVTKGRAGWNRVVASCTGSQEPRVQANRGAVGSAASGTTNGVPASRTINIGHSSFIFGGGFADALVFDRDLLGDSPAPANLMSNAEYLELAHAYLDEQTGGFV